MGFCCGFVKGPEASGGFPVRGIPSGLVLEKVKTWRNSGQGNSWEYRIG